MSFSTSRPGYGSRRGSGRLPPRPWKSKSPQLRFADLWVKKYPGVPIPPLPPIMLSLFKEETAERVFLALLSPVLKFEQLKDNLYVTPLFLYVFFFTVAGYSATLREYFRGNLWTYGLGSSLPGIAQVQQQQLTTFQYITAPTSVEQARQLGTVMSTATQYENPAMQFLETPFVKRLDLYPHAALLHMTPQWTTLVGENYTTSLPLYMRKYHRMFRRLRHRLHRRQSDAGFGAYGEGQSHHSMQDGMQDTTYQGHRHGHSDGPRHRSGDRRKRKGPLFGRGTIPIFRTLSTLHPLDYQSRQLARPLDSWVNQRFFFDLADEVPTRLEDSFGFDPTYRISIPDTPMTHFVRQEEPFVSTHTIPLSGQGSTTGVIADAVPEFDPGEVETFEATDASMVYGIPFPRGRSKRSASKRTKRRARFWKKQRTSSPALSGLDGQDVVNVLNYLSSPVSENQTSENQTSENQTSENQTSEKHPTSPFPYMDNFLGYSPEHAISQSSWILDLAVLHRDALAWLWTKDQSLRMKSPKPPVLYPSYKVGRYKSKLDKSEGIFSRFPFLHRQQRASLKQRRRASVKERMAMSLKREKVQGYMNSFAAYHRARRLYSLRRRMSRVVNRLDAPLRASMKELSHFWSNQFPSLLADRINHAPLAKSRPSWALVYLKDPSERPKNEMRIKDLSPGSLDWYAHRPVTRQDWHRFVEPFFRDKLRVSPKLRARMKFYTFGLFSNDFTVSDMRYLMRSVLGINVKKPKYLFENDIRSRFQFIVEALNTFFNKQYLADVASYWELYQVLASKGFSTGPLPPMDDGGCPLPSGLMLSTADHPTTSFLDEPAFYTPIIDWLEGEFSYGFFSSDDDASRVPFPKGLEFHWAIHANHLATLDMSPNEFIDALTARDHPTYVPDGPYYRYILKTDPRKTLAENILSEKRAVQVRTLLKQQTAAYITALESAGLREKAFRLNMRRAGSFLKNLHALSAMRRMVNELGELVQQSTSMRSLSLKSVRSNWYRRQPEMTGFLFPDESDRPSLHAMIHKAYLSQRLGSKSWWESFQAMTALRPMEIFLPGGYRLFASQTMPDFTRPRTLDYRPHQIFPRYTVERHPLQLPGYDGLKDSYPDLDVSFFSSPPKPERLRRRVFIDPLISFDDEDEDNEAEELEEGDWSDREWREEQLSKIAIDPAHIITEEIGPYPDYFNYSTTLAMQDGELDLSDNWLYWIQHYYLGALNWLKDGPANFFGRAGGIYGEYVPNFRRKIAFEQMRSLVVPSEGPHMRDFLQDIRLRTAAASSGAPQGAPFTRLPSQLEDGNGLWSFFSPSTRSRAISIIRRLRYNFFVRQQNFPKVDPPTGEKKNVQLRESVKHSPPFKIHSINTLPELSMDDWYRLFHLAIKRVQITGDPQIYLDIPAIRPVIYNRPIAFSSRIHVDPLLRRQKRRTQAIAQLLFAASRSYDGSVDIPDYLNPRHFAQVNPASMSGESRHVLPIFWHYVISKYNIATLPNIDYFPMESALILKRTKFPQQFQRRTSRRFSRVDCDHILQAENFLRTGDVTQSPFSRNVRLLIPRFYNAILKERQRTGKGMEDLREPISVYSWFILFQAVFVWASVKYYQAIVLFFTWNVVVEGCYEVFPVLQWKYFRNKYPRITRILAYCLRNFYRIQGFVRYQHFRIIPDSPNRLTNVVGIDIDVLIRSAAIVVTLRNGSRGGPRSLKGVVLYGPPGNGKNGVVETIAGEAQVPLIRVPTGEFFNQARHESAPLAVLSAFSLAFQLRPSLLFIDDIDRLGLQRSKVVHQEGGQSYHPGENLVAFLRTAPAQVTQPLLIPDRLDPDPARTEFELEKRSIEGLVEDKLLSFETEDKKFVSEFPFEGYFGPEREEDRSSQPRTKLEMEQVASLTAFLLAMDTIRPGYGMVVIGATEYLSRIDPAILRDGRLDRHIPLNDPSEECRMDLLKIYLEPLGVQEELPLSYLVDRTRNYSMDDLQAMINRSALTAILRNEQHTLASLEESLVATLRYRAIRADIRPFPVVHQLPKGDPLFFLRLSYYQASRALIHNILPDHPRLPFVHMQIDPFIPDVPIEHFRQRAYNLQDLIDRLAAMLSGKAGEYLLLYGAPFASQDEVNERQAWESTLGTPELAYAVDLAYAIADQWLLLDEVTVPLCKLLNLAADDTDDLFFEPGGDIGVPHFLRFNLQHIVKQHARLPKLAASMNDKTFRIYSHFTHTVRWFAYTKATLNFIPEEYDFWYRPFASNPPKRRELLWEPREQYYATRPYFKILNPLNSQAPLGQRIQQAEQSLLDEDMTKVCPRPLVPAFEQINRDYLMFAILVKTFNTVVQILSQHRPIVDRMAQHLRQNQILRSPEIFTYIRDYTAELRAAVPETPVRTDPIKGEILDVRQEPQSRILDINGRKQIVIDQSWGLDSRKPIGHSIPINVATEGSKSPVWAASKPEKPLVGEQALAGQQAQSSQSPQTESSQTPSVDQQTRKVRKGDKGRDMPVIDYLAATDMEFKTYRDWFAERHNRIRKYFAPEIASNNARKSERRDRYVGEALISMVPGMQSYLDRVERQLLIEKDWGPAADQETDFF